MLTPCVTVAQLCVFRPVNQVMKLKGVAPDIAVSCVSCQWPSCRQQRKLKDSSLSKMTSAVMRRWTVDTLLLLTWTMRVLRSCTWIHHKLSWSCFTLLIVPHKNISASSQGGGSMCCLNVRWCACFAACACVSVLAARLMPSVVWTAMWNETRARGALSFISLQTSPSVVWPRGTLELREEEVEGEEELRCCQEV